MVEVFLDDVPAWLRRFARRPWTLIHQDYELDNILFAGGEPVIVDWQSPMRSFPGMDLGWLLMASHNDETLAREPELLDHYRAGLAAAGGPQWSADDLAEDLAWAAFFWVSVSHIPFMDTVKYGEQARSHRRFKAMFDGTIAAAGRWDAAERMRARA
jgi:aminoglycoside phosphotransferase (APT) family kinase protein